jgi:hypothetical protein
MFTGERMFAERLLEHLVFNRNLLWDMLSTKGFRYFKLNPDDSLDLLSDISITFNKINEKTDSLTAANFNGMIIRGTASSLQVEQLVEAYPNDKHFFFKRIMDAKEQGITKRANNMVNVIPSLTVENIIDYNQRINDAIDSVATKLQLEWNPTIVKQAEIMENYSPEVDSTGNAKIMFTMLN